MQIKYSFYFEMYRCMLYLCLKIKKVIMKRVRFYLLASLIAIISSCSLTADLEEMHSTPLPNLENTDGNAGGTGGSNPPPPGK